MSPVLRSNVVCKKGVPRSNPFDHHGSIPVVVRVLISTSYWDAAFTRFTCYTVFVRAMMKVPFLHALTRLFDVVRFVWWCCRKLIGESRVFPIRKSCWMSIWQSFTVHVRLRLLLVLLPAKPVHFSVLISLSLPRNPSPYRLCCIPSPARGIHELPCCANCHSFGITNSTT